MNRFLDDDEQTQIWASIGAFQDGVYFASLHQYEAAATVFESVTRAEPEVAEAWANLGYARLMQYCDMLEPGDIVTFGFDLGHLVADGFYRRAPGLERRVKRAIREDVWKEAVKALERALELNPRLTMARANLGIAYLVGPDGRRDLTLARSLLTEAYRAADFDPAIGHPMRLALLLNLGAAEMAAGDTRAFTNRLQAAEKLLLLESSREAGAMHFSALQYGRAIVLSHSESVQDLQVSVRLLNTFLRNSSRSSLWWPLARERYENVLSRLGRSAEPIENQTRNAYRRIVSIAVTDTDTVTLGGPISEVVGRLGEGQQERIVRGTSLVRHAWERHGLEVVSSDGRVLLIRLKSHAAPAVPLRPIELGGAELRPVDRIRVGTSENEIEGLLGRTFFHTGDYGHVIESGIFHRYYPEVGLAIRLEHGRVEELVIVHIIGLEEGSPEGRDDPSS